MTIRNYTVPFILLFTFVGFSLKIYMYKSITIKTVSRMNHSTCLLLLHRLDTVRKLPDKILLP